MHMTRRWVWVLTLQMVLGAVGVLAVVPSPSTQPTDMRALDGVWVYVDDLTEGRTLAQLGPPMSSTFALRVESDAVVLVSGHGSGHRNVRIALDGSMTTITEPQQTTRYRGTWKDGTFTYEVDFLRQGKDAPDGLIRRHLRVTPDGLTVRASRPPGEESVAIYKHAADIPLPTPAKATVGEVAWLVGDWAGTRGEGGAIAFEERWGPPLGGAMLATARTVSRGRMTAFEYLRIVERDGGLVYVAQPNGAAPTEFVLTEVSATRAVFDNPRHDYPKRIVYELSAEGRLTATTGFMKGGTPRRMEFTREGR
jgi:hypothetical protein